MNLASRKAICLNKTPECSFIHVLNFIISQYLWYLGDNALHPLLSYQTPQLLPRRKNFYILYFLQFQRIFSTRTFITIYKTN